MRVFVALPVPEALRRDLVSECEHLAGTFPSVRWTPVANLHLTLRFLGEVRATEVAVLGPALRRIVHLEEPFDVTVGARGVFPSPGRPRVLWLGIEPSRPLMQLQEAIGATVEELLGLEGEPRPFHPHLTLGRCRYGWKSADAERWRQTPSESSGATFTVTYVDLMESRLTPHGATHRCVERLTLGS